MKKGDVILCPVFSIANIPKTIVGEVLYWELVTKQGQYFLRYRVSEQDLGQSYEEILAKFRLFCTGLSVATIGHFWVQDVLFNEDLKPIWERKKIIELEVDREVDSDGPKPLTAKNFVSGHNLTVWIAKNYPRVFIYHALGLFLLRSSFSSEYLYADVLLNFFKIVELVTYKRAKKKPGLGIILKECKALKITVIDEPEIREFYKVRSRDSAHDWDKVCPLTRRKALECKMWADELIIRDMLDRSKKPDVSLKFEDSPQGAAIIPKFINNKLKNGNAS